jgi:hypothetical protein
MRSQKMRLRRTKVQFLKQTAVGRRPGGLTGKQLLGRGHEAPARPAIAKLLGDLQKTVFAPRQNYLNNADMARWRIIIKRDFAQVILMPEVI